MKTLFATLLLLPVVVTAQPSSTIYFDHSYSGSNSSILCDWSSLNIWLATSGIGDGTASISFSTVSNVWVVSGLTSGGEWSEPFGQYPPNGSNARLYNSSGAITGYFGSYYLHFNNISVPTSGVPVMTIWTTQTTNYWSAPGDVVYFSASGRNWSSGANSNQLVLTLNTNAIFTGPFTAGCGFAWTLSGSAHWDGTNLYSVGHMLTGDTNTPEGNDSESFTNVAIGTNAWQWTVQGDTNGLTFDSINIVAGRAPTNDFAQHAYLAIGIPGTIYASNTWNLTTITSAMPNFSTWVGNSNGCCQVTLSLSNGVVRYLQTLQ